MTWYYSKSWESINALSCKSSQLSWVVWGWARLSWLHETNCSLPEAILCSIVINLAFALGITNQVTPLWLSFSPIIVNLGHAPPLIFFSFFITWKTLCELVDWLQWKMLKSRYLLYNKKIQNNKVSNSGILSIVRK